MSQAIRLAIVDDDADMRETIAECLLDEPSMDLCYTYCSGEEILEQLQDIQCDVVLMDIHMTGISGIECVHELKKTLPDIHVVMLTVFEDTESIFAALSAGADGYLIKHSAKDHLVPSIREVLAGGAPMSMPIARMVVKSFQNTGNDPKNQLKLSPREREVLDGLARGLLYKNIADELKVSMGTVRTHIEHIYRKLHVHNRTEAVVKFLQEG